jgi:hypothetical protein
VNYTLIENNMSIERFFGLINYFFIHIICSLSNEVFLLKPFKRSPSICGGQTGKSPKKSELAKSDRTKSEVFDQPYIFE